MPITLADKGSRDFKNDTVSVKFPKPSKNGYVGPKGVTFLFRTESAKKILLLLRVGINN